MNNLHMRMESVFSDVLNVKNLRLADSMSSHDIPGWDSLAHVKLITALEDEFGVRFTLDETIDLASVADLKQSLSTKVLSR